MVIPESRDLCNRKSQRYQIGVKEIFFVHSAFFEKRPFSCCSFFAVRMSFPSWSLQSQMGEKKLRKQQHGVSVGLLFFALGAKWKQVCFWVSLPLLHLAAVAAAANNPRELVVTCCCLFSALLTGGEGEPRRGICLEISLPPTANWGGNASSFVFFSPSPYSFSLPSKRNILGSGFVKKFNFWKRRTDMHTVPIW